MAARGVNMKIELELEFPLNLKEIIKKKHTTNYSVCSHFENKLVFVHIIAYWNFFSLSIAFAVETQLDKIIMLFINCVSQTFTQ